MEKLNKTNGNIVLFLISHNNNNSNNNNNNDNNNVGLMNYVSYVIIVIWAL